MGYDEEGHLEEVFANFGRTYCTASMFEMELTRALLTLDFLRKQTKKLKRVGRSRFDRAKFEAAFDAFRADLECTQTVGAMVRRLGELTVLDDALRDLVERAKERRNFLAHHFWRGRAQEFRSRKGRDKMLVELQEAQQLFEDADRQLTACVTSEFSALGTLSNPRL